MLTRLLSAIGLNKKAQIKVVCKHVIVVQLIANSALGTSMLKDFRCSPAITVIIATVVSPVSSAQSAAEDRGVEPPRNASVEIIEVRGERQQGLQLSPKDQSSSALFGGQQALADIARSLTPISADLVAATAMSNLHDVAKVAPNSFAAAGFGAPSLPTIRGQLGEVLQNGMRRQGGNNGLGLPLSFNSVGQLEVVRGVPPVILGSTQRTGGFVNVQAKRPTLEQSQGVATLQAGRWDAYRAQLDYSQVLEPEQRGARVSFESIRENSFYDYSEFTSDSLFASYRWLLDSQSELNIYGEFYQVDWTDNAGFNRPTQALIDHGLYVQGQGQQPNGSLVPGAFAVVSPSGLIELPRNQVYTDPDDINNAQTWLIYGDYQRQFGASWSYRHDLMIQHLQREEIAQNSFVEIIDGATTIESRSTWQHDWNAQSSSWFGGGLRYHDVLGYSQFTTEADLPVDLSGPLSNRRIPLTVEQQARLVLLRPGVYVSPGSQYDISGDGVGDFNLSDTTDSRSYQWSLFAQHREQLNQRWTLEFGLRADWYQVDARDPIAPPGEIAASDSYSDWLYGAQASAGYKLTDDQRLYVAANYTESTSNSMAGGTVLGADQRINPLNFATANEALEIGYKYAPLGSPWYADINWFRQTRSLRNRDGSNSGIKTQGIESQLFYQTETLWLSAGYSYLSARFDGSAAFQDSRTVYDAFDTSRPDLVAGTGVGAPNFAAFPASSARVQGLPDHQLSVAWGFKLYPEVELGGQLSYHGDYKLDYLNSVRVREQHTLNLFAQWQVNARLSTRFDLFNVTDQENWSPVFEGGYFGSTLVFPELPRHAKLTVKYAF